MVFSSHNHNEDPSPTALGAKSRLDDTVPNEIDDSWRRWRSELPDLSTNGIPRCYFPKDATDATVCSIQIHGFSDASENAYAVVVYLRIADTSGNVHISLVASKTKVSPIKRLSIPRLELCGAHVLARILQHTKEVLQVPLSDVFAWTDSTIVVWKLQTFQDMRGQPSCIHCRSYPS